jgi:hypothetical protein
MPKSSISFPYFIAEFIEADEGGKMRDAIQYIAREKLK